MTEPSADTRSVVVEREFPYPPEKIWRALTQPHLLQEWLMKNDDFKPVVGYRFNFERNPKPDLKIVVNCEVLEAEPRRTLSYTWVARDLEGVVTWTLTPTAAGTHLRMEHAGFQLPAQKQAYGGAMGGWRQTLARLEQVLAQSE